MKKINPKEYIAVLSLWKRGQYLEEQLECMRSQSAPPKEIWLCWGVNDDNKDFEDTDLYKEFDKVYKVEDGGSCCSRYEMCKQDEDQYFLVLDDDMFPTDNYMERCISFIEKNGEHQIGCSGRIFLGKEYFPNIAVGSWNYKDTDVLVHIGTNGHFITNHAVNCLLEHHDFGDIWADDIALGLYNWHYRKVATVVVAQDSDCNADKYKHERGCDDAALSKVETQSEFYKERNKLLANCLDLING